MKQLKIFSFILITIFLFSCNEIDNPLKERTNTCGEDDINFPIRKILVEDYTGQTCGNCPEAAEILHKIKEDYCEHIIPLAVHVGFFAVPDPAHGFPADYRTEAGNELGEFFENDNALPNGLVNRAEFNEKIVLNRDEWRSAVDVLFSLLPDLTIEIESSYDENTNEISVKIISEIRTIIPEDVNLAVYLAENNIISPQKDYSADPSYIENYVHNHMLRKAVNGAFGEKIASSLAAGDIITKNYTFAANSEWVPENCEIVAFISYTDTKEIIQAESELVTIAKTLKTE
jgi:thiol-disulfide isomerase/thioredoxin